MELENRIAKASGRSCGWSGGFRDHQHINWLAGFKRKAIQDEFAMVSDSGLSPVCFHALSIEDPATRRVTSSRAGADR